MSARTREIRSLSVLETVREAAVVVLLTTSHDTELITGTGNSPKPRNQATEAIIKVDQIR